MFPREPRESEFPDEVEVLVVLLAMVRRVFQVGRDFRLAYMQRVVLKVKPGCGAGRDLW